MPPSQRRLVLAVLQALTLIAVLVWVIYSYRASSEVRPRAAKPVAQVIIPAEPAVASSSAASPSDPSNAAAPVQVVVPVIAKAPAVDPTFKDFRAWTDMALAPGSVLPGDFQARGVELAKARRVALAKLIVDDPERAIAEAVSPLNRQQLPAEIVAQLEDRVSTRANFDVLATLP